MFKCNDCGEEFTASMNDRTKYAGEDRSVYDRETEKMVLTLRDVGNMPFNKIVSVISGLTNNEMNLSEGYVNKVFCRASRQLIQFRDDLKKVAVQFPQIGWDDTGLDVDGTLMCARVQIFSGGKDLVRQIRIVGKNLSSRKRSENFPDPIRIMAFAGCPPYQSE